MNDKLETIKQKLTTFLYVLKIHPWSTFYFWFISYAIPRNTGIPLTLDREVTPFVIVGPQYNKIGLFLLKASGVTHVVNMRYDFDDQSHGLGLPDYCYIPIDCYDPDDNDGCIKQLFIGVDFIQKAVQKSQKVYIHCHSGVHRSTLLAMAYLVSLGHTVADAIDIVYTRRPELKLFYETWMSEILDHFYRERQQVDTEIQK
jgi:hypothetical protein